MCNTLRSFSQLLHIFNISLLEKIIEFFRKFTVNEPGVGDICKFATFPLQEHGNKKYGVASDTAKQLHTKHGKLEKSFLNFKANHPEWKPPEYGEKYLSDLQRSIHSTPSDIGNDNNTSTIKSGLFSSTVSVTHSSYLYRD